MEAPDLADPDLYLGGVPHGLFARLRDEDPVHWNAAGAYPGFWAVTRHADIVEISRQPKLFSSATANGGHRIFDEDAAGLAGMGESAIGVPMISTDPPEHLKYRKIILPALAPGRIAGIEERIVGRVEKLLADVPMGEPFDLVERLAAPLPILTLCELIGVDPDMWRQLYRWTNAFVGEDDPDFRASPEALQATLGEFMGFAAELYEERRRAPGHDIASHLANSGPDGEPAKYSDFLANLILTLVGGNETTRNSISHSVIAFARDPGQWALLREQPELMPTAPREMVRHASPVLHMRRTATADTELGGKRIRRGDRVVMWYPSGNRDAAAFERPDAFDLRRGNVQHVGFGSGQHVCAGSRIAEMQLRVLFGALARRVAGFEVRGEPRRFRSNFINGLKSLKVVLEEG
ncbi:cytochrome P450 [Sandaracinobacteroides hominis]|uniref:cytochrome P450 n=1 Tax=Sandaracinobacteroides hominis TaxID=2780086 RepID=UPI0018F38007|nr:cytochrome P450 [Sandaracinobacteroides hominis]